MQVPDDVGRGFLPAGVEKVVSVTAQAPLSRCVSLQSDARLLTGAGSLFFGRATRDHATALRLTGAAGGAIDLAGGIAGVGRGQLDID